MREHCQNEPCPECGHPFDTRPDDTEAFVAFRVATLLLLIAVVVQILLAPIALILALIASFQLSKRTIGNQHRLSYRAWKQRRFATVLFCIWFCELAALIAISEFAPSWLNWW